MDSETSSLTNEQAARALIESAAARLRAGKSGAPAEFVSALFSRAVAEDIVRYEARDVAGLAESAWEFLAVRQPGASKVRFEPPSPAAGEPLKHVCVVEIAN